MEFYNSTCIEVKLNLYAGWGCKASLTALGLRVPLSDVPRGALKEPATQDLSIALGVRGAPSSSPKPLDRPPFGKG